MSGVGSTEPPSSGGAGFAGVGAGTSTQAEPERRPRLNPFAFPSDTVFRFGLLIAAVLGANLYVWQWIGQTTRSPQEHVSGTLECLALSPDVASSLEQFTAANDAFRACTAELYRYQFWWMLGGTAALLLAAAAIMLALPLWITRRRRLRPLAAEDAPAVLATVAELAREQELDPPRLLWNPLDPAPGGLAFGHPGRYSVAVSGGLVVQQATDPAAFRAVVRHELAHIKNRDVGITYFTLAVWYAFLLVAVVPFWVSLVDAGTDSIWTVSWRLLVLAALVYLTRNAVLRSREIYADVRASVPDGREGALRRVLAGLPRPRAGALGRVRRLHPDPERRLALVDDTRPLFPLGALVAFAAGLTATIAFESVVTLLYSFVADPLDHRLLAALAFAPLVVGVVGVAVWREAFAAHADGREPAAPWIDGLALGAGLLLGPELALERLVSESTLLRDLTGPEGLLWIAVLVIGVTLLLAWIRTSASWWLRALGGRRSRTASVVGLLIAGASLAVFLGFFFAVRATSDVHAVSRAASAQEHAFVDAQVWAVPRPVWQFVRDGELLVIVQKPYFVPVLALLVLFPLAAVFVRRRPGDAPWAFLDPGGVLHTPPLSLRAALPLLIGAVAGVAFLVLAAIVRLSLHYGAAAETRAGDATILSFFVSMVALALLVQLFAGAAGAWHGGLVGALGAAFVAGCFGWLGIVGGPAAGGCVDPLSLNPGPCAWTVAAGFSWDVFKQVVAQGALAGLAGGLVALGVRALLGRRRPAEELQPAGIAG
jgi:Zn-dependent protease with chaperone function